MTTFDLKVKHGANGASKTIGRYEDRMDAVAEGYVFINQLKKRGYKNPLSAGSLTLDGWTFCLCTKPKVQTVFIDVIPVFDEE
jgi:hypothetical protein